MDLGCSARALLEVSSFPHHVQGNSSRLPTYVLYTRQEITLLCGSFCPISPQHHTDCAGCCLSSLEAQAPNIATALQR